MSVLPAPREWFEHFPMPPAWWEEGLSEGTEIAADRKSANRGHLGPLR